MALVEGISQSFGESRNDGHGFVLITVENRDVSKQNVPHMILFQELRFYPPTGHSLGFLLILLSLFDIEYHLHR